MSKLIRKLVVFNEEDMHQNDLLHWCYSQSSNFSGFIKHVLFSYRSRALVQDQHVSVPETNDADILDILG
jgi:hypothetical protein